MAGKMDVEAWVTLFREIGLDEEKMHLWHRLFERHHPESHQDFLRWLGCSDAEIMQIRQNSR
ncbi:MAG: hypothetical protein JW902_09555 [Syntrophaceae bacterium]|nr:hypothetical protein [Syntrophaceae bacterium]